MENADPEDIRNGSVEYCVPEEWPWFQERWKPTPDNRIRELVKAGALIAAEIDRMLRLGEHKKQNLITAEDCEEHCNCVDEVMPGGNLYCKSYGHFLHGSFSCPYFEKVIKPRIEARKIKEVLDEKDN
jgi:hypothetical protein